MKTTAETVERLDKYDTTMGITYVGDNHELILPEPILKLAGLEAGDTIFFEVADDGGDGKRLQLRKIDPDQAWFWTHEWQLGELEADAAKAEGRSTVYYSPDEFLDSLK